MIQSKCAGPPCGTVDILKPRTLANSHPTLLSLLKPGSAVLDVGCGPGTLTAEIARRTDPGPAVGMDVNPEMIRAAEDAHPPISIPNLVFYVGDIRESQWNRTFDLVNAARTLQWIPDVDAALSRIARATAPGGQVVLLDRDHTMANWSDAPAAWTQFYHAFLAWRTALGLDNAIGRHLAVLGETAGLVDGCSTPLITTVRTDDADFFRAAGFWRMIAEGRGREMVAAGYLGEADRNAALSAFTKWMRRPHATQTTHETCFVARRP